MDGDMLESRKAVIALCQMLLPPRWDAIVRIRDIEKS